MYYINKTPNESGNHGNPRMQWFQDCLALPDDLLMDYISCKGFCTLSVADGVVTALEADKEALDAYQADHPDTEPEKPVTMDDLQAENAKLKQQVSALADQQSFYEDCIAEMASVVYA